VVDWKDSDPTAPLLHQCRVLFPSDLKIKRFREGFSRKEGSPGGHMRKKRIDKTRLVRYLKMISVQATTQSVEIWNYTTQKIYNY